MQLHELKPTSPRKTTKRIGRGGKRGKMSGRGHKGQTVRAGNSTRPEMREQIKKLPKLRGHGVNRASAVNAERVLPVVINLGTIDKAFDSGSSVTPKTLVSAGLLSSRRKRVPQVKILATGDVTKKLIVSDCVISATAKEKIEKAGGVVK